MGPPDMSEALYATKVSSWIIGLSGFPWILCSNGICHWNLSLFPPFCNSFWGLSLKWYYANVIGTAIMNIYTTVTKCLNKPWLNPSAFVHGISRAHFPFNFLILRSNLIRAMVSKPVTKGTFVAYYMVPFNHAIIWSHHSREAKWNFFFFVASQTSLFLVPLIHTFCE